MDIRFDGKTALVTGAASGIGAAIARDLAASGAAVIVADLTEAQAAPLVAEITAAGGTAWAAGGDVAKPEDVAALVARAVTETGRLDLVVNNAGIGGPIAPVGDYPVEGWQKVIDVNLNGVFYGIHYAIPELLKAGGGAIVNVSSILGSVGTRGSAAYSAAKHGVLGMTKSAAAEYADKGIRINSVGPGYIDTPLLKDLPAEIKDSLVSLHPIGRLGTSEEVSTLVLFLLSDQAAFITGSYHLVDGGYTAL